MSERSTRRKLLLPLAVCVIFLLGFESGGYQLVIVDIAKEFGLNRTMMGVVVMAQYAAIFSFPLVLAVYLIKLAKSDWL